MKVCFHNSETLWENVSGGIYGAFRSIEYAGLGNSSINSNIIHGGSMEVDHIKGQSYTSAKLEVKIGITAVLPRLRNVFCNDIFRFNKNIQGLGIPQLPLYYYP